MKIIIVYFKGRTSYVTWCQLGMLVSALKEKFEFVDVINVEEENLFECAEKIQKEKPDIVFACLKFKTYDILKRFLDKICVRHFSVFSSLPNIFPEMILEENPRIDSAIYGEPEFTVVELVKRIKEGTSLCGCKGVVYREQDGSIVKNERRELIKNPDELPFANRDCFPVNKRFFHILGSRGCMGKCSFCTRNVEFKESGQTFRSIKNIIQEVKILVEKYQCKYVGFSDSTFCGSEKGENGYVRLKELYEALSKENFRIEFFINLRAEQITDRVADILGKLTTVGLSMLFLGLESFNAEDLRLYHKMSGVADNLNAVKLVKNIAEQGNYFLSFEYGFMNFNPYSTIEGIKNNIKQLKELGLPISPEILTSYLDVRYGTQIYERVLADGLCSSEIDLYNKSVAYNFKHAEVKSVFEELKREFSKYPYDISKGVPSLYNRYVFFVGATTFSQDFLTLYKKFMDVQTDYCYRVFLEITGCKEELENCSERHELEAVLADLHQQFKHKFSRLILELQKIKELSYF